MKLDEDRNKDDVYGVTITSQLTVESVHSNKEQHWESFNPQTKAQQWWKQSEEETPNAFERSQ